MEEDTVMVTIDKVVLIHPMKYVDRLNHLLEVYPSCLPKFEIPPALTGDDVNIPEDWIQPKNAYALLQNVISVVKNLKVPTLILEDDVRFSSDFEEILPKVLEDAPDDYDLLYLGGMHLYGKLHKPVQISKYWLRPQYMQLTTAIIYNPKSKDKILDVLNTDNWKGDMHVGHEYDQAYGHAMMRMKLKVYSPIKHICGQNSEPSTIRDFSGFINKPAFYNTFKYISLDGTVKQMTEDTSI